MLYFIINFIEILYNVKNFDLNISNLIIIIISHMIDYINIYHFWKTHPNYWISIDNKERADLEIYNTFYEITKIDINTNNTNIMYKECTKTFIGYIILCDQFQRHFNRHLGLGNNNIEILREQAVYQLDQKHCDFYLNLEEDDLYFCLMSYKHLSLYTQCIKLCIQWCNFNNRLIKECSILSKFFNDTYAKCYTLDFIKSGIKTTHTLHNYNFDSICDYYPEKYKSCNWLENIKSAFNNPLQSWYDNIKSKIGQNKITVSLSGGIDSMVILMLLKNLDIPVSATHIIYGNREVSNEEYRFIATYCHRLSVPLYSYHIEYFKRDSIDRTFYEKMTRNIRFNVYKSIENSQNPVIILGHIRDDVIENIWTNLSKCQHLHNLGKMCNSEIQLDVQLERPFLNTNKSEIYKISETFGIPYLKNTTPSWSNRGKFRETFYKATHNQFGQIVDKNILMVSDIIKGQYEIIERLVYRPIIESFHKNILDITLAIKANLDLSGWVYIIEHVCHHAAKIAKPSFRSIEQFVERLRLNSKGKSQLYQMKNNYQFLISCNNYKTTLEIIIKK